MADKENRVNKRRKKAGRNKKNDLPVFDSDHDFLRAFTQAENTNADGLANRPDTSPEKSLINQHGIAVMEDFLNGQNGAESHEDFSLLLAESFNRIKPKSVKKPIPMPLRKRLKRYPPVEAELDLHGYNTIGAQMRTRSFITSCKHQGFFTIRIIVGKGLHSETGPVLPDVVEDEVKEMKKQDQVLSYAWDRKKKARSGALIVYLKQFD